MPRVLVVDDQADVRTMISIVLRIHRFEIVEADSAASALKLFEDASFDLAIVDIFLQGTNGSDLIAAVRARVPDLPVIAISGMTALDLLSETPELSDVICLQKPFRPPDLMRAIDSLTAQRVADHCHRQQPQGSKPDRRQTAVATTEPTGGTRGLPGASRIPPGHRAATRCWR